MTSACRCRTNFRRSAAPAANYAHAQRIVEPGANSSYTVEVSGLPGIAATSLRSGIRRRSVRLKARRSAREKYTSRSRQLGQEPVKIIDATQSSFTLASRRVDAEGHQWWQHAVFYEIYPRSFADSNNDGIGDLNGISSKMSYLHDLGVDAIWITPCYPSPQVDFGYDISDYENIDPMYGTLADFDHMVAKARNMTSASLWISCRTTLPTSTVVSRFEILAHVGASRLVYLARRQRRPASLPIIGSRFSAARPGSSIPPPISTITTFSTRSSLT
jgi:hypothetical protein